MIDEIPDQETWKKMFLKLQEELGASEDDVINEIKEELSDESSSSGNESDNDEALENVSKAPRRIMSFRRITKRSDEFQLSKLDESVKRRTCCSGQSSRPSA
ncbi:MAG: hypothetical protein Q8835_03240 [Sweet potato little leaf phytoplasma]|nr:hypothetical protein [Sweet potato little leaf phytoplasma]